MHVLSFTLSPLRAIVGIGELTGELRVADRGGVAVIGGGGAVEGNPVWEAGAQGRYYAVGSFEHGMELGGQLRYDGTTAKADGERLVSSTFSLGPFLGYKYVAPFGLTFDGHVGAAYVVVVADMGDETVSGSTLLPLVNAQVGWSF